MIRWGILGAGNIAERFTKSLAHEQGASLTAVSCRNPEKGEAFAARFGGPRVHGGHESLLADPEVDAIYLALPHTLHAEWAVRALKAGKAVLCEKPAVMSTDEMRKIMEASVNTGILFMEAMKTRMVPLYPRVREIVKEGEIGEICAVHTSLCNDMHRETMGVHYVNDPASGGALFDAGTYCASWIEDFTEGDPEIDGVSAVVKDGILDYIDAHLHFGTVTATLECAFDRAKPRTVWLIGTKGRIFAEELHRTEHVTVYPDGRDPYEVEMPYEVDDFFGEIQEFDRCLAKGLIESPAMTHKASLRCAQILESIRDRVIAGQNL